MLSGYCATKGGVRLFTKSVALECAAAKDGVRVNSLHPGITETAIWDTLIGTAEDGSNAGASAGRRWTNSAARAVPARRTRPCRTISPTASCGSPATRAAMSPAPNW